MSIYKDGKLIAGGRQCMPLLSFMWADHELNDVSWLRADTFSWQNGAVYQAAYAHLVLDIDGKTLQSETIDGITVQFYLADDGHKICPDTEESNVAAIYNKTGNAWYYIIDTTNQRFKLPRRHSQQIVRSVKNADGSWYRLYADGWVEQGSSNPVATGTTVLLPVEMADSNYIASSSIVSYTGTNAMGADIVCITKTTTTIKLGNTSNWQGVHFIWEVKGMAAIDMSSFQDGEKHLYFYVGSFTQTALENTAGLNAELFNGKVDLNLNNINPSQTAKETIVGWGIPDLTTGVSVSTSGFTSTKKQWLCIRAGVSGNHYFDCQVNGIVVSTRYISSSTGINTSNWYPLDVGDVVTFAGTSSYFDCATYDMKGL